MENDEEIQPEVAENETDQTAADQEDAVPEGCPDNNGKTVSFHYTSWNEDGEIIETSRSLKEPITFECGKGLILDALENTVRTMAVGEIKTVEIENAYGEYLREQVKSVPREELGMAANIPVGKNIMIPDDDEGFKRMKVVEITESYVTLDGNHPLAGKTIKFEVEVLDIKES